MTTPRQTAENPDRSGYEARLKRVIEHIYAHLDDELDMGVLAEVACLSPYHWHRIYQGMFGESVVETVRRVRLQRASVDLTRSDLEIAAIGARAGYASVAAFNRAFAGAFGMPPARYRRTMSAEAFTPRFTQEKNAMHQVEIRRRAPARLAVVAHRGPYIEIGRAFQTLYATLGARGLMRPDMGMIALYYDDPAVIAPEALRADAGVTVGPDFTATEPLRVLDVAGGDHAVLLHKGPYERMAPAYQWLFGEWIPASGREVADAPAFEVYLNTAADAAPPDLLTEICVPLKD
jgi:AraC family transcriptional regulator